MNSILGTVLLALVVQALPPLQGTVVRKGTAEPLSRATVELRRDQDNAGLLDSTTTEDDGRFSFGNVIPGRYRLSVTRRGYTRPPLTITLAAGQPAANFQLNMTLTSAISGRVYDAAGRPTGNVEVRAMKASYPEGRRKLTAVQSVQTNDLGEYRLFWLPPGRYYVAAVHPKAQSPFRFMLSSGGTLISGGQADPALGGIPRIADLAAESEHYAPIFFGGTTDEQTASAIDLRENADFGGANIVVAPVQARHVRGVVVDGASGKPAQYGNITLPKSLDDPQRNEVDVDRETGAFDMLLFPGPHTLTASSASGDGYAAFTLGDADIEGLTIPTSPVFELPGRIVVDGEPVNAAAMEALHLTLPRDPLRSDAVIPFYETPRPDGSFTISASAGDFRLNIAPILNVTPARFPSPLWPLLQNAYVKSIRLGNADVLNGPLHLEGPPSATLEVVIGTNPGAFAGQVVTRGSGPGADIPIVLLPNNRGRNELYRATITDGSGQFHFDRVPPGDYKVFSWEEVEDGAWYDAEFMSANESRGIPVRIGEGQTVTARIEAIP